MEKPAKTYYFPFSLAKIHYYFNPRYFFREMQIIRLYIWIFTQIEDKKTRAFFERSFQDLRDTSQGLFDRLYKSDIELFAQLIDSNPSLLRRRGEQDGSYYYDYDLMRGIEKHLALLEKKGHEWILERVFSLNPGFLLWFSGYSIDLGNYYKSKYQKTIS